MPDGSFLLYGATGYTGKLTAGLAKAKGMAPILAGRNADKLKALSQETGLPWEAFDLGDSQKLDKALAKVACVLHMAGPFSATSKPMVDACLRTGRHYLDITGEIDVFEVCAARNAEAKTKGVMLMPGVGFDVVPSDCLAAHMKRRMPDAAHLAMGLSGMGNASRGTAKSMVEGLATGTRVRRDAKIATLPRAPSRRFDFGQGDKPAVGVSWGDVATAWHSTGIPNIEIYFEAAGPMKYASWMGPSANWLLGRPMVQRFLKGRIEKMPEGPTDEQRAKARHVLIGEARNATGETVRSRMTTPEGYTLTSRTSLEIASRVCAGKFKPGFQTPSLMFGPDFILDFEGCRREDLNA
jgi:short subunit dehydrogenase-like uncharacterized protein